ncbi:MAG: molybdopterin-dependent oxidoreductase [Kiritimatiellae bacterium]|nr:molybdopterin-dependent oxidoreductase [Kiritimatiellia bacterium]
MENPSRSPEIALRSLYGSDQFQIGAISSHITHKSPPPFSAHFCEVEVDTLTGRVRVLRYVAAVDCGTAVNPKLAEGQTEGGVLNGISYALTEQYRFSSRGRMLNPSFAHYKIMSMRDKPALKTILVPSYEKEWPVRRKERFRNLHQRPAPLHRQRHLQCRGRSYAQLSVHAECHLESDSRTRGRITRGPTQRTTSNKRECFADACPAASRKLRRRLRVVRGAK